MREDTGNYFVKKSEKISSVLGQAQIASNIKLETPQERMDFSKDTFGFSSIQKGQNYNSSVGESIVFGKEFHGSLNSQAIQKSADASSKVSVNASNTDQDLGTSKPDVFNLTFQNMDFSNFQNTK
jgi:hypothetical protein